MAQTRQWLKQATSPPKYLLATLVVSLGGFINGFDTSTIGPVISMPFFAETFGKLEGSLQGTVVSSIMLSAFLASIFAGNVADAIGRPRTIAIGSLVVSLGAALEAGAVNLAMFLVGRFIVGAGEGIFLSSLIVYTTEISPPRWRGALCTTVQLFTTLGLVTGFFTAYGTVNINSTLSWRLPFAIHAAVGMLLCLASCFYLPHSPRWLSYQGRKEEASKTWDDLGVSSAEREKDLLQNPSIVEPSSPGAERGDGQSRETREAAARSRPRTIREKAATIMRVFGRDSRKATLLGFFVVSMQQLSGIDGILFYAPQLFEQAGLTSASANFLASGVSAICIFVFTILAVVLASRWGRRPSTIWGGTVLFACMALMGLLYATGNVHPDSGIGRWVVIASIYIFAIIYSMTWAIGLRIFASEIQPIETRATATSMAQALNCLTNWFVAFITPVLLAQSSYAIYMLFGGCVALTVIVSIFYMPETEGQDLEMVRDAFLNHKGASLPLARMKKGLTRYASTLTSVLQRPWVHTGTGTGDIELDSRSQSSKGS